MQYRFYNFWLSNCEPEITLGLKISVGYLGKDGKLLQKLTHKTSKFCDEFCNELQRTTTYESNVAQNF
jgi:hypothetical protein